jgi:drug/metabolite transporter (DMT)-like permease
MWPIILITVALLILALLISLIVMRNKMKHKTPTDYYNLFVIGLIWMAFGALSFIFYENSMSFFFILGLAFAVSGLVHKDKWKKNRRTWKDLTPAEQKLKTWIIIILGVLALAGLVVFLLRV